VTGVAAPLRGKQRRHLRGLGVNLSPVVQVGKEGVTDAVLGAIEREIGARELVKIRLLDNLAGDRKEIAREIAERSGTELVQVLGRTLLLWRRNPEEPVIELPE
jgi:RNA-binding protein